MNTAAVAATLQQLTDAISSLREKHARYELDYQTNKILNDEPASTVAAAFPIHCVTGPAEQSQLAQLNSMSLALNELEEKVNNLTKVVNEKVTKLEKATQDQASKLDDLEQYSRRNCLILHGCPNFSQGGYRDMETFVLSQLNTNLRLNFIINPEEIDILHPLPSRRGANPIIVRFLRRSVRNAVYVHKKFLINTNLSITESLTKVRLELLKTARLALGFKNIWTWNGTIYGINDRNHRRVIKCNNDIQILQNL